MNEPTKPAAPTTRLTAYSIKNTKSGAVWVRVGMAYVNRDGSLNVLLDALPMDGKLHLRTSAPRQSATERDA